MTTRHSLALAVSLWILTALGLAILVSSLFSSTIIENLDVILGMFAIAGITVVPFLSYYLAYNMDEQRSVQTRHYA